MAWLLVAVTVVLAAAVAILAILTLRLQARVGELESRLEAAAHPSSDPFGRFSTVENLPNGSLDEPAAATTEYVITRVGDAGAAEEAAEPVPALPAPVFADLVLKETVVQTASLFQGLRRALAPETRNRIRFHMRQEVKRSRKQRRAELKEVRREWAARQRAAMTVEDAGGRAAEGTAA